MNYHEQMKLLSQREAEYLREYPNSGQTDLRIVRAYLRGTSVETIAMEIPCSEATVYRAIQRVREFLGNMGYLYETLREHVLENPNCFGCDAKSILEMLFCYYEDCNHLDTPEVKNAYKKLYKQLDGLSLLDTDCVIDAASVLSHEHEKMGFVEGVKVGVRMGVEFYSRKGERS